VVCFLLLLLLLLPLNAEATCQGTAINYGDFSFTNVTNNVNTNSIGVFMQSNQAIANTVQYVNNTLQLMPHVGSVAASAWFSKPFVPACTECFNVSFQITFAGCAPCSDGVTFVIQNVGPLMGLGGSGVSLGLFGGSFPIAANATASQQFLAVGFQPVKNVTAVYTNTQQNVNSPYWSTFTGFPSGSAVLGGPTDTINVWLDNGCQGGNLLNVYYSLTSTTKPSSPQLVANTTGTGSPLFNTAPSGGSSSFYVGFTAGSGTDYSTTQVDNFYFNSYSNNACSLSCPAATTGAQCYGTSFNLTDFSTASINATAIDGMTLNGNAVLTGNTLQLVNATGAQAGSAFFNEPFNAQCNECFSATWQTTIDLCGISCADGVMLVLSSSYPTALGNAGNSLGFINSTGPIWQAYLGVGIETYSSAYLLAYNQQNQVDGSPAWTQTFPAFLSNPENAPQTITFWVDNACSGSSTLNVYASMNGTKPSTPTMVVNTGIPLFQAGTGPVFANGSLFYVGLSGSTGGANERTRVSSFSFTSWSVNSCSQTCPSATASATCPGTTFDFPDFSSASLAMNQGEFVTNYAANINNNYLQLISDAGGEGTSAWYSIPFSPACYECFQANFTLVYDTCGGAGCGDGIAFVIQNIGTGFTGSSGGAVGAVPFPGTTYTSAQQAMAVAAWIYGRQIEVYNNTNQNPGSSPAGWCVTSYNYASPLYFWIDDGCSGMQYLNVYVSASSTKPSDPLLSVETDGLVNTSPPGGSQNFYVGFTGGSGGAYANIRITSAYFTSWTNDCRYPCQSWTQSATKSFTQSATNSFTPSVTASATHSYSQSFTHSFTHSATATATASATASFTESATGSFSDSATQSYTQSPTASATASPTASYTESFTNSATASFTASATDSYTASATDSLTDSATASATESDTFSATASFTASATDSFTDSATASATDSATASATDSFTDSATASATESDTYSATASLTVSATASATESFTQSATGSATVSVTASATETATESATQSATQSATLSATLSSQQSATDSSSASATATASESMSLTLSATAALLPATASSTASPTAQPSVIILPTTGPTDEPSAPPTVSPSTEPSSGPSLAPSVVPSSQPTTQPSSQPSTQPSQQPSAQPSAQPSTQPSVEPSSQPSNEPSVYPSSQPTSRVSGLYAVFVGATEVTLAWSATTGSDAPDAFVIKQSTDGVLFTVAATVTTSPATLTGLVQNTVYYIQVFGATISKRRRAEEVDTSGAQLNVTTAINPPGAVSFASVNSTGFVVSWEAPVQSLASSYVVSLLSASGDLWTTVGTVAAPQTALALFDLDPSTVYSVWVQAALAGHSPEPTGSKATATTLPSPTTAADGSSVVAIAIIIPIILILICLFVLVLFCLRRRHRKSTASGLSDADKDVMELSSEPATLHQHFVYDMEALDVKQEPIVRRTSRANTIPDNVAILPSSLTPRARYSKSPLADATLVNTLPEVALPGFLKLDFAADLRAENKLAKGGMSSIWQVTLMDRHLVSRNSGNQTAALKYIGSGEPGEPLDEDQDDLLDDHFHQEVSIMWSLSFHRNVIKMIGYTDSPRAIITPLYKTDLFRFLHHQDDDDYEGYGYDDLV